MWSVLCVCAHLFSAVGNLADEGEWWNALEADAIPHVPRDSQSAKANAVVAAALSRPSRTSGDASSLDTTSEARDGGESAEAASTSEAGQPKPGEAQPKVAFSRAAPGVTTDIGKCSAITNKRELCVCVTHGAVVGSCPATFSRVTIVTLNVRDFRIWTVL